MSLYLNKQEQSRMASATLKYLAKSMPHTAESDLRSLAVARLDSERPTYPWEYPWVEVVRWCRDRRRT